MRKIFKKRFRYYVGLGWINIKYGIGAIIAIAGGVLLTPVVLLTVILHHLLMFLVVFDYRQLKGIMKTFDVVTKALHERLDTEEYQP